MEIRSWILLSEVAEAKALSSLSHSPSVNSKYNHLQSYRVLSELSKRIKDQLTPWILNWLPQNAVVIPDSFTDRSTC
jgi:hypothetical protein